MSTSASVGCFFLDTNIVLSDILKENTPRIEKLKKDADFHKIPCYISDSVKKEIYEKVQGTCDFLGNVVRETIKYSLEESRKTRGIPLTSPMTSEDVKALEELFSYYQSAVRTTRIPLPAPVAIIEEWAITFLGEKFDKGEAIDVHQFLVELTKKLLTTTSSIEDLYDDIVEFQRGFIKTENIIPNPSIINALQSIGIHEPDDLHIASAFFHQTKTGEKTVFVTLDYNSILNKRYLIWKQLNLKMACCDPLYALHYLI